MRYALIVSDDEAAVPTGVTHCQPVTGGSTGWLIAGVVSVALGLLVLLQPGIVSALRQRRS